MDNELKLLKNGVVPVYQTDRGEYVVYGRDLWKGLQSRQDFSTWMKKRISDCDAVENVDFTCFHEKMEANNATKIEYVIILDTAKEMAMLERNDVGKDVRKYFISIDKEHRQTLVNRTNLSPTLQMVYALADTQAKMEIETKRLTLEVENVKKNQDFIKETFATSADTENFKAWVNRCVGLIAESPEFTKGTTRTLKYTNARTESYERLKKKRNCNLNDRVQRAKGRAIQKKPSISKAELNAINKLSVIADDKDLRVAYESVIREMMLFYCVAEKAEV